MIGPHRIPSAHSALTCGLSACPTGTLVVPTHTPENTDPAGWPNPPVPEAWWSHPRAGARVRSGRHPGQPVDGHRRRDGTELAGSGAQRPSAGVVRGGRPEGRRGHRRPSARRPGAACWASVTTPTPRCTWPSGDSQAPAPPHRLVHPAPGRLRNLGDLDRGQGRRKRLRYDRADFETASQAARVGRVGNATARRMSQRQLVDFATQWTAAGQQNANS